MVRYIIRRVIFMLPVALLVSFMTFMLIHLIPGDPARVLLGEYATPQSVAALQQELGLNKPIPQQFALWLWQAVHGNLGESIQLNQPVTEALMQRLPVTIELGLAALLFSLVLAVPLAVFSATHRNSWIEWLINISSLLGTAVPSFVLALILIYFFAVFWRPFPPGGYAPLLDDPTDNLRDLVLPMIALGTGTVAVNLRQIRASMTEMLEQDFVRTARAKGLSEGRVTYIHALRNALIPLITLAGLEFRNLFGGALVTETVFSWPGVGRLYLDSLNYQDYSVILGLLLVSSVMVIAGSLLADVLYAVADPRIRLG